MIKSISDKNYTTNAELVQVRTDFLPMTTPPTFEAIPQFLKDLPRWLCWRFIPDDPKPKKVPVSPKKIPIDDGKEIVKLVYAAANDPKNWLTFDEALKWFNSGACSGIGFALTNTPPKVCCVDVDHCFSADGVLTDEAKEIIALCKNSFVEKSQSGEGIHIWFLDDEFDCGRRGGNVEVYATDRYIAMTGNHVEGSADELLAINGTCAAVIQKFIKTDTRDLFEPIQTDFSIEAEKLSAPLTDDEKNLVEFFKSEKCESKDPKMYYLFRGDKENYVKLGEKYDDDSVVDCALMTKILYYVGGAGNDDEIAQKALKIFGQSNLSAREKWLLREDYRRLTLEAAFVFWHEHGRPHYQKKSATDDADAKELSAVNKKLDDFEAEKNSALELLAKTGTFDSKTVNAPDVIKAAAFAKIFAPEKFAQFKADVHNWRENHKSGIVNMNDFNSRVTRLQKEILSRNEFLVTQKNQIESRINSKEFAAQIDDDVIKNFEPVPNYSVGNHGVYKVVGENLKPVANSPIYLVEKLIDDDENFKYRLAYINSAGVIKKLPPFSADVFADARQIVKLSKFGVPVTSTKANLVVDFIDDFKSVNENLIPMKKIVSKCGWHGENFVDPRRKVMIEFDGQNIPLEADKSKEFTKNLISVGSLEEWVKAYEIAKKSPVARFMVAASVAPPLLEILNERIFLVHIWAKTTSGKTTALNLGASAIGSEKVIRTFDATQNGLIGAAADVSDYAFLVDEKQVADSRMNEQHSRFIYALTNGIGRTKLNRDSTLKSRQEWQTIIITTGETEFNLDNATGGAFTRHLAVHAPDKILDGEDCGKIRKIIGKNFGHALPLVIDKIFSVGKENLEMMYESLQQVFKEKFPDVQEEHRKYVAVVCIADTLLNFALYGGKVTLLNGEEGKPIEDATLLGYEIFPLIPTLDEISDVKREKEFVLDYVAQNQNHFINGNVPTNKIQGIWGEIPYGENPGEKFTYVAANPLKAACEKARVDYRKLVADLIAAKFFIPDDIGEKISHTVVKKLDKAPMRCYRY